MTGTVAVVAAAAAGVPPTVAAGTAGEAAEGFRAGETDLRRHLHRHYRLYRGDGDGAPGGASEDADDPSGCAPLGHSYHPPSSLGQ